MQDPVIFSTRIVEMLMDLLLANAPSFADRVNTVWKKLKDSRPLMALVFAVRVLRNMLDNADVDYVRQRMRFFMVDNNPTAAAFSVMQVTEHERTMKWIDHCIRNVQDQNILIHLSKGNPFVLLEFFNQSVLDMVVVTTNLEASNEDFLTEIKIPEFLRLDREKLTEIRLDLSTCDFEPKHLMEIINSRKWKNEVASHHNEEKCPAVIFQASEKLRRILQLNRFFYGQIICRHIVERAGFNPCLD